MLKRHRETGVSKCGMATHAWQGGGVVRLCIRIQVKMSEVAFRRV